MGARYHCLWLLALSGHVCGCSSDGAGGAAASGTCEQVVARYEEKCGDEYEEYLEGELLTCQSGAVLMKSVRCDGQYSAYLGCVTTAEIDCATGEPLGCTRQEDAATSCAQQFVQATGCVSLGMKESTCPEPARPYTFGCTGTSGPFADCVAAEGTTSSANYFCCP
jgi:hypothetical protein